MFENEEIEWSVIDPWWRTYSEHHQEDLKRLHEIMKDLSIAWDVNDSRFNRDPLAVDWTESSPHTGPLQTNQEENWSDWLAHLLRASSGQFIEELLQTDLNSAPLSVKREKCFFLEEKTERRADILLYYENRGISIEVKLDDQHYAKTPHTASLIEGADQRDWKHFLLLPQSHKDDLGSVFGNRLGKSTHGRPTIRSERFPDVDVMYWQDVSYALRRILLFHENELNPHWEASAYLLITLIEQKLFGVHPRTFVEKHVYTDTKVTFSDIERVKSLDVAEQVEYLLGLTEEINYE